MVDGLQIVAISFGEEFYWRIAYECGRRSGFKSDSWPLSLIPALDTIGQPLMLNFRLFRILAQGVVAVCGLASSITTNALTELAPHRCLRGFIASASTQDASVRVSRAGASRRGAL